MPSQSHLLTIASEQLWPQLLGLSCLIERDGGVKSLHILHSADFWRSEQPAKRLTRLATAIAPGLNVRLHPTGTSSQQVHEVASRILQLHTDAPWEINCTGGTKLMFAGLIPHLTSAGVEAFYREVNGEWFRLRARGVNGAPAVDCIPFPEAAAVKSKLTVLQLIEAQSEVPPEAKWLESSIPEINALDVIREGIHTRWDWGNRLAEAFPQLPRKSGPAFEILFAALVRLLPAANVALSVRLSHRNKEVEEFDVVASTGRNLVLFDLKLTALPEDQAPTSQLMRIASNRTALGGLGGTAIAVRPSWPPAPELRDLAKSLSVELWTSDEIWDLVPRLARVLDVSLGDTGNDAGVIDSLLRGERDQGRRVFTYDRAPRIGGHDTHVEEALAVLNVSNYFHQEIRTRDKPVVLIEVGTKSIVYGLSEYCGWGNVGVFKKDLTEICVVEFHETTATGGTFFAVCKPVVPAALALLKQRILKGQLDDEHMRRWDLVKQELAARAAAEERKRAERTARSAQSKRHSGKRGRYRR